MGLTVAALLVLVATATVASAAATSAGQVYAFGSNFGGVLRNSTNNGTSHENLTPGLVNLPGATGPGKLFAAGSSFSLAGISTSQLFVGSG